MQTCSPLILLLVLSHACCSEGATRRRRRGSPDDTPDALPPALVDGKIVGGEDAQPGEFPYQVSIQQPGFLGSYVHVCGGTVINDKYILTAAHCLEGLDAKDLHVVAGVTYLQDPQAIKGSGKHIITHEGYNAATKTNDIALLKLNDSLQLESGKVEALDLPNEGEEVGAGTSCTVVGWGSLTESGGTHNQMQKLDVSVVADGTCKLAYGEAAIGPGMICAGRGILGAGACHGDQGGPLVCLGRIHGVGSWGEACSEPFYPGVYSEVAHYRDWIIVHTSLAI